MVYFMENPKITWMIWGDPHDLGNLQIDEKLLHHEKLVARSARMGENQPSVRYLAR
jgi:hypothetical protein